MPAISEVSICNLALSYLGEYRITSLTEDVERARRCNSVYSILRDQLLEEHPWNFSIKTVDLAQSSTTPAFGYDYSFVIPDDCLRIIGREDGSYEFNIEGREFLCDQTTAAIRYIARITNPTTFSYSFVNALSARIAARLAYAITNSRTLAADVYTITDKIISRMKSVDAQEGTAQSFIDDTWINDRI